MQVSIGISNRHIHLTKEDFNILFKENVKIEVVKELNQKGEYASNLFLKVKTDKSEIDNIRVLGPLRDYTQVELSKTDCYTLGIDAPVLDSGDLENAAYVKIIGPFGTIERKCAIIANRHIHINPFKRKELGLEDTSKVKVMFNSEKGGIIDNVYIKETKDGFFELHLDTDDANAHLLKSGDIGTIL